MSNIMRLFRATANSLTDASFISGANQAFFAWVASHDVAQDVISLYHYSTGAVTSYIFSQPYPAWDNKWATSANLLWAVATPLLYLGGRFRAEMQRAPTWNAERAKGSSLVLQGSVQLGYVGLAAASIAINSANGRELLPSMAVYGFSAIANFRFAYPTQTEKMHKVDAVSFLKNFTLNPFLACTIPLFIVGSKNILNESMQHAWKYPALYPPLACMAGAVTYSTVHALSDQMIPQFTNRLEKVRMLRPIAKAMRNTETFPLLCLMAASTAFGAIDVAIKNEQGLQQMELFTITYGSIYVWMKNGGFMESCREMVGRVMPVRNSPYVQLTHKHKTPRA